MEFIVTSLQHLNTLSIRIQDLGLHRYLTQIWLCSRNNHSYFIAIAPHMSSSYYFGYFIRIDDNFYYFTRLQIFFQITKTGTLINPFFKQQKTKTGAVSAINIV